MIIQAHVKPNSKKGPLVEVDENNQYTIYLQEKPIDGEANKAVVKLIASYFNKRQNQITIKAGLKSQLKIIEILD